MTRTALFAVALLALAGCSKRQGIARSPDQFKDDVGKQIEARKPALEACRREIPADQQKAKVSVEVSVQIDQTFGNKVEPKGNGKLDECVKNALSDVRLDPVDQNMGLGTWVIAFDSAGEKKSVSVK